MKTSNQFELLRVIVKLNSVRVIVKLTSMRVIVKLNFLVVAGLVVAVIDHEHVKLRLLYSRKKKLDKTVENLRNEVDELKVKTHLLCVLLCVFALKEHTLKEQQSRTRAHTSVRPPPQHTHTHMLIAYLTHVIGRASCFSLVLSRQIIFASYCAAHVALISPYRLTGRKTPSFLHVCLSTPGFCKVHAATTK